jgi:hypothetical protein
LHDEEIFGGAEEGAEGSEIEGEGGLVEKRGKWGRH